MANLFTSETPSVTDASDGTPGITTGTTVVFAVDGTVTGVRFYATETVSGTYTGGLWTVDSSDPGGGTLLRQTTMSAPPSGGEWNLITFVDGEAPNPYSVTAGIPYRVGAFSGDGRYVATLDLLDSPITNGDIAAPEHGATVGAVTISQGVFRIDASFGYPNGAGAGGTCYFVDVEFAVDATPIAVADTGSVASSLLTQVSTPVSDTAAAADVVSAEASLPIADDALAADTATVAAAVGFADAGQSGEALSVLAVTALTDAGAAVDAGDGDDGSAVPKSVGDTGSAAERLRTTTVRPFTGITARPFTGITLRP